MALKNREIKEGVDPYLLGLTIGMAIGVGLGVMAYALLELYWGGTIAR